jgi:hypothetical protein
MRIEVEKISEMYFFLESEWDVIDQGKIQVENRFAFRFTFCAWEFGRKKR